MAVEVRAPLGGGTLSVLVEPGAKVAVGDELLILEAMKMNNVIYAPAAGTVSQVRVKAGDVVVRDAVLVVIDEQ
jgi:biotin carboxyl carrier protein